VGRSKQKLLQKSKSTIAQTILIAAEKIKRQK
jgi:hypothetical protein